MIEFDDSELEKGLAELELKFQPAFAMYCETAAAKLETEAKKNRPWTDRTSRARETLKGTSEVSKDEGLIVLAHGVDYGVWLELAHEKKYAIVEPTVRLKSNEVFKGLEGFIDKIGGLHG